MHGSCGVLLAPTGGVCNIFSNMSTSVGHLVIVSRRCLYRGITIVWLLPMNIQ